MDLEIGAERTSDFTVEDRLLTDVGGTIGSSVLSTPGMIAMMERNSAILAFEQLPEGSATVGFEVCVKHVAAALEGSECIGAIHAARGRGRAQAPLLRRGDRGRAHDRRRHARAPRDPGRPARLVPSCPESVRLREVGPRDGFQNEPETIPTAEKVRLIGMLGAAGYRRIELTSFVRADVIPQLADANEVLDCYEKLDGVAYSVLIPNEKGLDNALERRERFDEVNLFLSASETHNRKNVNRSIEESLTGLERVIERALAEGLRCEGVISTSFGCPYEGHVPPDRVFEIAERLRRRRLRGDRLRRHDGDGEPAPGRVTSSRAARNRLDGCRADRSLPQHARPGTRERARGARAGHRLVRVGVRRARRLPRAAGLDGQHLFGRPRLDARGDGHRYRHRLGEADRGIERGTRRIGPAPRSARLARGAGGLAH